MRTHIRRYPAPAHTYYLDNIDGLDANTGVSPEKAWKTLESINNSTAFKPGDRILLKCGVSWTGGTYTSCRVIFPASGKPGRPIFIGSYGSGAKPAIDSSAQFTDFSLDSGSIYKRDSGFSPQQVFESSVRLTEKASKGDMVAGTWFWDEAGILYVWCSDSGNPNLKTIEHPASYRSSFDISGKHDITLSNLSFDRSATSGIILNTSANARNIFVQDCNSTWHKVRGFDAGGYTSLNLFNILIERCSVNDCLGEGIFLANGYGLVARNCTVYNGRKDFAKTLPGVDFGGITVGIRADHCSVLHCLLYDISVGNNIYVEFESGYTRPEATLIEGNKVLANNEDGAFTDEGSNTIAQNNWFENLQGNSVQTNDGSTGLKFYNNTLYGSQYWLFSAIAGSNITIKGNIFYNTPGDSMVNFATGTESGLSMNNNCFYPAGGGYRTLGTTYYNLANWVSASGQDANSIEQDPKFVTPGSNYHLQTTSPCKNTGPTGLGVLADYDSVNRDATPDMGAFEFVA